MNKLTGILIVMLILILQFSSARSEISTNQTNPSLNWKKIDTEHFRVIFTDDMTEKAQKVANTLETVYQPIQKTMPGMKKWPVILYNHDVVSNGQVFVSNRRSEYIMSPPQRPFAGTVDWETLLSVHEPRHMAQMDKADAGFLKLAKLVGGEGMLELATFITIPAWFWEGDAVDTESALSQSGRGRNPQFLMPYKALFLEDKAPSFYQSYLGSLKEYYADWYTPGYIITTRARREYGADVWDKTLARTAAFPFLPARFAYATKHFTGKKPKQIYNEAVEELTSEWQQQLDELELTPARMVCEAPNKAWTLLYDPTYNSDGSIIVGQYSLDEPMQIVQISADGAKKCLRFCTFQANITASANKVAWESVTPDVRYSKDSYSDIYTFDIASKTQKKLTTNGKLFAPVLSPDGSKIVAVKLFDSMESCVVVIDSETGKEICQLPHQKDCLYLTPCWSNTENKVAYIKSTNNMFSLAVYDLTLEQETVIIEPSTEAISTPDFHNNYIAYGSPYSGIDNIYVVDLLTNTHYQVTSRKYGAFGPDISPDGSKMIFADYFNHKGYVVAEIEFDPSTWISKNKATVAKVEYFTPLIDQEQGRSITGDISQKEYAVTDFAAWKSSFNFHSWSLFGSSSIASENTGVEFNSTDLLETTEYKIGLNYNKNEEQLGYNAGVDFAKYFPIFRLNGIYQGRSDKGAKDAQGNTFTDTWKETKAEFGVTLPFTFTRNNRVRTLQLASTIGYTHVSGKLSEETLKQNNGYLVPLKHSVTFVNGHGRAQLDVASRWAQKLYFSYTNTPFNLGKNSNEYKGSQMTALGMLYFPGMLKHHSLRIGGSYEMQDVDNYKFEREVLFARGYSEVFHKDFYKFTLDYELPLFYPDLNVLKLAYIQRIRADFFYDYGIGRDDGNDTHYRSAGTEINFDLKPFGISVLNFTAGLRTSYRIKEDDVKNEFIFSMSL